MSLELQAKLLRVIENSSFTPVGGTVAKQIDVRIIAATHANLPSKIIEGTFREDFYYRLARFPVEVPPLRERQEDIPLLVNHFLNLFAEEMGIQYPAITPKALEVLEAYHFPGNVRELKNIIENALIRGAGGIIVPEHLHIVAPFNSRRMPNRTEAESDAEAATQQFDVDPDRIEALLKDKFPTSNPHTIKIPPRPQTEEDFILAYVEQNGSINNTECRGFLNVDLHHASYLLRKMHKAKVLICTGGRRWARYRLPF